MQPFSNIRALDFTHVYAGPFATYQLAVMGAEVIKVEPPDNPDMMRCEGVDEVGNQQGLGSSYIFNNQGKKAICLDLHSHEGKAIACQLIETADVLVENYSHGLGCFGLDSKQALKINPRLIYCDMSAYGPANHFAGRPAFDPVIQATSGMMSVNGESDQDYLRVGPPLIDYGTGAQAAFAIASALFQRSQTGKGQVITVNMLDAALVMMSPLVANAMISGKTDERSGNVQIQRPGYSTHRCRRGDLMVGAFTLKQQIRLFTVMSLAESMSLPDRIDVDWIRSHGKSIREKLSFRFAEKDAEHWEQLLNENDVPASRVRDLYEALVNEQPQRAAASQHQRLADNSMTAPIAAFTYAHGGPELEMRCAQHGEDTAAVLNDLGYDDAAVLRLKEAGVV